MPSPTLRITCTSSALAGNPAWAPVSKLYRLDFGDFGDWPTALLGNTEDLVWLCFLSDLIPSHNPELADSDQHAQLLEPLLAALTQRLRNSTTPTVVAWSGYLLQNPIENARHASGWKRLRHTFEASLYALTEAYPALYVLNLDEELAPLGFKQAFDPRNFYSARCHLSQKGLRQTSQALATILKRIRTSACKVLVLDCDNTLWGGVVGEQGLAGLTLGTDGLGKAFADFQQCAAQLGQQGILLALASKNNENEVWEVFDQHPYMQLKRNDVVAWRINWQEKAQNIAEMAQELGLGLDSFVFWDDNPLEREKVRLTLPAVHTIEAPTDVLSWPELLRSLEQFARFTITHEDRHKTEQYRTRAQFVNELRSAPNTVSFLRAIELQPSMVALSPLHLARAEQLCAKTNQFNLRTVRYSQNELLVLLPRSICFLAHLKDRFGDHGIVGLCIARLFPQVAFLDTFLLSCRVLGRQLESWMLAQLVKQLQQRGIRWLLAEFRPSGRNTVAADFLAQHSLQTLPADAASCPQELRFALNTLDCTGALFFADLEQLKLPPLDIFTHEHPSPR